MIIIIHIVEHFPKGTIYNLVFPLTKHGHKLIYTPTDILSINEFFSYPNNTIFVLHTTGRILPVFRNFYKFVSKYRCALFLHVSLAYMEFQGRYEAIKHIKSLYKIGVKILSPCAFIFNELQKMGIRSSVIQIGIPEFEIKKYENLHKYCGKIITCCSENTQQYIFAKGIDDFERLVKSIGEPKMALIAGCEMESCIDSRPFTHDEFLFVLSRSKMYVQLSKFESYNLTAVEAKRLNVPVVALNREGISDNIRYGFVCDDFEDSLLAAKNILEKSPTVKLSKVLSRNHRDSVDRESDINFVNSLNQWSEII